MYKAILTDLKGEIVIEIKTIAGDFNISFTPMHRSFRQEVNKETSDLNDTLDQQT